MKALLFLALAACATEGAEPSAPYAFDVICVPSSTTMLACDFQFDDPDGDVSRVQLDVMDAAGEKLFVPPLPVTGVEGVVKGMGHFDVPLDKAPAKGELFMWIYVYDAAELWTRTFARVDIP
jgi:hypothetical protein